MLLLDTPRPLTFEQIVSDAGLYPDREESSRKAFERDKSSLRSMGVEIRTEIEEGDRGATRYNIDPDEYFLPDLGLSDQERLALQLGAAMVQLDASWDDDALRKIGQGGAVHIDAQVTQLCRDQPRAQPHQPLRLRVVRKVQRRPPAAGRLAAAAAAARRRRRGGVVGTGRRGEGGWGVRVAPHIVLDGASVRRAW